jgi:hypothetical protein
VWRNREHNHWLKLRLAGTACHSPWSQVHIRATLGGRDRLADAGNRFLLLAPDGLRARRPRRRHQRHRAHQWPSGTVEELEHPADQILTVTESAPIRILRPRHGRRLRMKCAASEHGYELSPPVALPNWTTFSCHRRCHRHRLVAADTGGTRDSIV